MKIVWTNLALGQIEDIAEYIALDKPKASRKWKRSVYESIRPLRTFPNSGRVVPELNRKDVREILYGNYRIIYKIETNRVSILTVRHGKRLLNHEDLNL